VIFVSPSDLQEEVFQAIKRAGEYAPIAERIEKSKGWAQRQAIREFYAEIRPELDRAEAWRWAIDPYAVNWPKLFTPIEMALWMDIRGHGLVLYPQFPVGRYFADFANPRARVVVECDGAAYHDPERDEARDGDMRRMGWTVYRFAGSECVKPDELPDRDHPLGFVPNPESAWVRLKRIANAHGIWSGARYGS
jgi:very-short-patch-repair endonuclease